jgi:hypothetical protein
MSGDGLQSRPRARAKYTGIVLDGPRRRIASGGVAEPLHGEVAAKVYRIVRPNALSYGGPRRFPASDSKRKIEKSNPSTYAAS